MRVTVKEHEVVVDYKIVYSVEAKKCRKTNGGTFGGIALHRPNTFAACCVCRLPFLSTQDVANKRMHIGKNHAILLDNKYYIVPTIHPQCVEMFNFNPLGYCKWKNQIVSVRRRYARPLKQTVGIFIDETLFEGFAEKHLNYNLVKYLKEELTLL